MSPLTGLPGWLPRCLVAWLPFDCDSFELARSTLVSHGGGDGAGAGEPPPGHTHSCIASRRSFRQLPHLSRLQRLLPHTDWLALALASASAFACACASACASTRLDATRCGLAWLGLFGLHFSWEISLMEIITFDYFSN